jgi:hypothetical protein
MLLAIAVLLTVEGRDPALAGAIVGMVGGYWLPTRPNRQPPA